MTMTIISDAVNKETLNFSIARYSILNNAGFISGTLPIEITDTKLVLLAYKSMVLGRAFDKKAIALQRTGKLGTYPSILGQEAISTAIGLAMDKKDIFAPYYRDLIAQYLRGVSLKEMLLYWGGNEQGSNYQNCARDFPNCIPIATQLGHAAGAAISLKVQGIHQAALVTCGDGATSKGDFLETLNLAGAWQLPLVMLVNNNQWAISTPRKVQCSAETIAQKAIGAGIEGVVVDGNDYFAVYYSVKEALKKAYAGKGATLIEAVTYRLGDHTTADDANRYRNPKELKEAWNNEPLKRMRQYLVNNKLWDESKEKKLMKEVNIEIEKAVAAYLSYPKQSPESMFEFLYESLPNSLQDQYSESKYENYSLK
ncbi:MAG: 2-oxoisovalerate dehydrogenase E1 component alpha subunit [Pseudohongiellaceae bacterium]|jgi:2-oxoisovalerate dehydrogenase E1 component alpha subunit